MSIDREFRFLNEAWNSLNSWKIIENSADKWKDKPSKMVDFVKNSTLKYLIPTLLITACWVELKNNSRNDSVYDESAAPLILDDNLLDYRIDQLKINTNANLFNTTKENIDDNSRSVMYDEGYDQNFISSIPLDEEFDYAPWTHMFQTTKENLYRSMYGKLSMEDYQELFKWLKDLRQWSLGNCYFVVAIKNLARSKYFDTLMMTSIEKNGDNSFNLYMPLWEPWWVKISITPDDLESTTIRWPLWYKLLEIWFAKYLLFRKWIILDTDAVMTDELMKKMEVWSAWETMMTLLWPKSFINECLKSGTYNRQKILNWLRNYDPKDLWIMSATSNFKKWKSDKNSYEVWWETVYYGHAYCICGVEKEWDIIKNVILENPWNNGNKEWGHKIKLTIYDFLKSFSLVNIGHKTDNFLNLSTTDDEIKVVDSRNRKKS